MTGMSACSWMRRADSMPSISPRRWISIRMRSGLFRAAAAIASCPDGTLSVTVYWFRSSTSRRSSATICSSSTIRILARSVILSSIFWHEFDPEPHPLPRYPHDGPGDLPGEHPYEPESEGLCLIPGKILRYADTVVPDRENVLPVFRDQGNVYLAVAGARERVLEGVCYQLADDEAERECCIEIDPGILGDRDLQRDLLGRRTERGEEVGGEGLDIVPEVDTGKPPGLVELFVDERHCLDPVLALRDHRQHRRVSQVPRLEVKEADDHLEVILHPVVDLF